MNARGIVNSAILGLSLAAALAAHGAAHASPANTRSLAAVRNEATVLTVRKAGGDGYASIIAVLSPKNAATSRGLIGLRREDDPFNQGIIAVLRNDDPFSRGLIGLKREDDPFARGIIAVIRKAGGENSPINLGPAMNAVAPDI